jgi:hypothetical protein
LDASDIEHVFTLADLLCRSAKLHLHTTILAATKQREVLLFKCGWSGSPPDRDTLASYSGPTRAFELLQYNRGPFGMAPVPGFPASSGKRGAVRETHDTLDYIVSCDGWGDWCNLQAAAVLLYGLTHPLTLHHVGFRYRSREEMQKAVDRDCEELGSHCVSMPDGDVDRVFIPVPTSQSETGRYWIEHHYNATEHRKAVHWDLVTPDPSGFLRFVAGILETETTEWENAGSADPVGIVQEQNDDNVLYGFMARGEWWDIE